MVLISEPSLGNCQKVRGPKNALLYQVPHQRLCDNDHYLDHSAALSRTNLVVVSFISHAQRPAIKYRLHRCSPRLYPHLLSGALAVYKGKTT